MLRHPFCASEMAIECAPCAVWLELRIDVEHELHHLAPVRRLCVSIQQPQIGDDVLLIVYREDRIRRCEVGYIRI